MIKAQYFNSITGAQTSKDCRVHRIDVLSTRPKAFLNDSFTAFKSVNISSVRCVFEKRKKNTVSKSNANFQQLNII